MIVKKIIDPTIFNLKRSISVEVASDMPASRRNSIIKWINKVAFKLDKIATKYRLNGITAGQLGINRRIILCNFINGTQEIIVNPVILQKDPVEESEIEQCVCFNERYHVKRPKNIKLGYYDDQLRHRTITFGEVSTRLILHLIDHLDYKSISSVGYTNDDLRKRGEIPIFVDDSWGPVYRA